MLRSGLGFHVRVLCALAPLFAIGACHKTGPTGPDPAQEITFRPISDIRIDKVLTPTQVVNYPEPIADGGVPPLTVTCAPPPSFAFSPGTTMVTCTATDGVRQGETHFSVTIVPITPVISLTKFLAFGDSITFGEEQDNPATLEYRPDHAYPTILQGLLTTRYANQTFTMFNEGQPGEHAITGTVRLGSVLPAKRPQVLLLLEGVIDLGDVPLDIPRVIGALRSDIQTARGNGVQAIFLSTLLPEKEPFLQFGYPRRNQAQQYLEETNNEIRALASRENVFLVDSYDAMKGRVDILIGGDGLHPTQKGFEVLAQTFFGVIKDKLELPPGSPVPTSVAGPFTRSSGTVSAPVARPFTPRR